MTNISVITARIRKCKWIIKIKINKHDKIVSLAETKLNTIEVSISNALNDSDISHTGHVWVNDVLKIYNGMKETIKNSMSVNSDNVLIWLI